MNNKVFYQHPNLMRALGMHETVMEVMVNVLGGGGDSKVALASSTGAPSSRQKSRRLLLFFLFRRSGFPRWWRTAAASCVTSAASADRTSAPCSTTWTTCCRTAASAWVSVGAGWGLRSVEARARPWLSVWCRYERLHPPGRGCCLLHRQQRAGLGFARAGPGNGLSKCKHSQKEKKKRSKSTELLTWPAGGDVPGRLRAAELSHAPVEGLPWHRLEPLRRREIFGFPALRGLCERSAPVLIETDIVVKTLSQRWVVFLFVVPFDRFLFGLLVLMTQHFSCRFWRLSCCSQERAWRRTPTSWCVCSSDGRSASAPPCEERGATVCWPPWKRPSRSPRTRRGTDRPLKRTGGSCERRRRIERAHQRRSVRLFFISVRSAGSAARGSTRRTVCTWGTPSCPSTLRSSICWDAALPRCTWDEFKLYET